MAKFSFRQGKYGPQLFNAALFFITLILNLNISWSVDDWKNLTDPYDYLHQSKMSLLDKEFYFPHKADLFDPRPFTVPLFYKLCHSNPDIIVQMQKVVLSLSTFFMAIAFMLLLQKNSSKYILTACVYLLTSWWNVLGWATLVLSESLSMSLFFCWLASFLFLYKRQTLRWFFIHAFITIFFSFTRDSWPYVLIAFYAGMSLLWLIFKKRGILSYISLTAMCVVIFFVQQAGAKAGLRYELPVINSIIVRILPNPVYTAWFVQQGMPDADKLIQNFKGLDVVPEAGQHKLWALYGDTAYQPFLNWVVQRGQPAYTKFLVTHPAFVLFKDETPAQLKRVSAHDLFYINEPRGYSRCLKSIFPIFNITAAVLLPLLLLGFFSIFRKPVLLAPLFLSMFMLLNMVLSYNADALEVERHLFVTGILAQLVCFWALALVWDILAQVGWVSRTSPPSMLLS